MSNRRVTGEIWVPQHKKTLKEAVDWVHENDQLTTIVVGKGVHQIDGDYLKILSAMNIVGDPVVAKEEIVIMGGIEFKRGIQGKCHLQHLTLCQAKDCGVYGESSFTMDDVLVKQCEYQGVAASGNGVVGRCTNVEVRQCGMSGVVASHGASITFIGTKTTVHHNCIKGRSDTYGLDVYCSSSTIQLVSPLTKEQVSLDNGGGGNWGVDGGADLNQIKTISQTEVATRGEVRVPQDCKTLLEAVQRVAQDSRFTTIVLGEGKHQIRGGIFGGYLDVSSAVDIVGDPGVEKEKIVIMGGIQYFPSIQGNCHLQHLTVRKARHSGVYGRSSFTMDDVIVEQCGWHGVNAAGPGVVGRCTNVEVRQCKGSGVLADSGASITLVGAKTNVHDNCTTGRNDTHGLEVRGSSATIQLVSPLTKEQVSINNTGGGNWGVDGGADEDQIKTISQVAAKGEVRVPSAVRGEVRVPSAARGEVRVPQDCKTLLEAVQRVAQDSRFTTIVVGQGEHQIDDDYLYIRSVMNIAGDPDVAKEDIVIVGGIHFKQGIQGCHLQHLTLRKAEYHGVWGYSSFTMDDVIVEQCNHHGVVVYGYVVARCTNVEVRQCGQSGVCADMGASITLIGDKTTVHHNCTDGDSDKYGLKVYGFSSTIQLVYPLTKEQVSINNGGGGNWGTNYADLNQIKTIGAPSGETKTNYDNCALDKILEYDTNGKKLKEVFYTDYIFSESNGGRSNRYTIRYYPTLTNSVRIVKVFKIESINDNTNESISFSISDDNAPEVEVHWLVEEEKIEIKYVYMNGVRPLHLCSRLVGYALKALLREAAIQHKFPYKGKVYIESEDPCAAVNCYTHAFQLNGFLPDKGELQDFKQLESSGPNSGDYYKFTFNKFRSQTQKILHDKQDKLDQEDQQLANQVANHPSMHQGSMHQESMRQESMHQESMHQKSMHQKSVPQATLLRASGNTINQIRFRF